MRFVLPKRRGCRRRASGNGNGNDDVGHDDGNGIDDRDDISIIKAVCAEYTTPQLSAAATTAAPAAHLSSMSVFTLLDDDANDDKDNDDGECDDIDDVDEDDDADDMAVIRPLPRVMVLQPPAENDAHDDGGDSGVTTKRRRKRKTAARSSSKEVDKVAAAAALHSAASAWPPPSVYRCGPAATATPAVEPYFLAASKPYRLPAARRSRVKPFRLHPRRCACVKCGGGGGGDGGGDDDCFLASLFPAEACMGFASACVAVSVYALINPTAIRGY
jgi:hypothetical protein